MQKKRKILWICISSICVGIILLGIVFKFAFKLKTVDVEIQMSLKNNSKLEVGIKDKISNYFEFGENIILMEFDEAVSKIEKELPYVEVNQIIKSFPNIVRIYISERIPKYKVQDIENNDIWYVLDEDFKVLDKINITEETGFENIIEIEEFKISTEEGEILTQNEKLKTDLNSIMTGVFGDSQDYSVVKSIKVSETLDINNFNFYITMRNVANQDQKGCVILIEGDSDLVKKSNAGMTTYLEKVVSDAEYSNIPSTIITIRFDGENYTGII